MTNIQRFYKLAREGGDFEIERSGAQVALRFRVTDLALRGLRQNSEFLAATIVRGCRDLTCQSISPVRAEFIHDEPKDSVEYANFLGCPVKFGAEWDAVIYTEETTRLPVRGADTKLLEVLEATCQKLLGPAPQVSRSRSRGPTAYHRKAANGLSQHRRNCRGDGCEQQDFGAPASGPGPKLQRLVGSDTIQRSQALS